MFEAVEGLVAEHGDLEQRLADPSIHADQGLAKRLNQRYAELSAIVRTYDDWLRLGDDIGAARELAQEDPSFAEEAEQLVERRAAAEERLRHLLVPRDEADSKDALLEIKSGEGGEESALFAGDLLRMYTRYAELRGWKTEQIDANESDLGGYKSVTVAVKAKGTPEPGEAPYALLKFEGGVHRVQRVPVTESQGRVHTSAAGVLVMPEAEQVDVTIEDKDLRIDVYRSVGSRRPVGQHHRLGGADHPRPDRHRGELPEREVPAPEPRAGHAHPAGPAAPGRPGHPGRRRTPTPASRRCARSTAPSGSGPTTTRRTASPTTAPATRPTTSTRCSTATSSRSSSPASQADLAARLDAIESQAT